ncbi:MAG TPA: hypothetical protein VGM64_20630 [Lacunisphaera sp.]|jgi:hypothetical protein
MTARAKVEYVYVPIVCSTTARLMYLFSEVISTKERLSFAARRDSVIKDYRERFGDGSNL